MAHYLVDARYRRHIEAVLLLAMAEAARDAVYRADDDEDIRRFKSVPDNLYDAEATGVATITVDVDSGAVEPTGDFSHYQAVGQSLKQKRRKSLSASRLRELVRYDSNTGMFTWLINSGRARAGNIAGSTRDAYVNICIRGVSYRAHILAWLYVHGEWPSRHIDHENGDTHDNRIANLREATRSQNLANAKLRKDSTTGLKGVSFNRGTGKWMACINKDGVRHYLGLFDTREAAHAAYAATARELHGDFARTG